MKTMDIDGDNLVILSRSGDARAKNAHDGNIITFHRVLNFRDLVYRGPQSAGRTLSNRTIQ